LYITYDQFHYSACKTAHNFLLCPETNPLHPRSIRPICEVQLLQDPAEIPDSCEIRHVQINTTIFHKLQFQNLWLYVFSGETFFITCDADTESSSHAIKGVGILRLIETCKGYATRDILIPGKTNQEQHFDFIPNSILTNNRNWTSLAIMRNKDILNSRMDDTHWVCYRKTDKCVSYYNSFGNLPPPLLLQRYFKECDLENNYDKHQSIGTHECGCLS
jgi:hypothetical protein